MKPFILILFLFSSLANAGSVQSVRTTEDSIIFNSRDGSTIQAGFIDKIYTEDDVSFSSTPAGWTNVDAEFIPYKTLDGTWRLKFTITAQVTSGTSHQVTVDGVTSQSRDTAYDYAITVFGDIGGSRGRWFDGNGNILLEHTLAQTIFWCSGEITLASKPTWAD